MNCKGVKNIIYTKSPEELTEKEKTLLHDHFSSCGNCSKLYKNINETLNLINEEKNIIAGDHIKSRMIDAISNEMNTKGQARVLNVRSIFQLAAAVVVLLISIYTGVAIGNQYFQSKDEWRLSNTENLNSIQYSNYVEEYARVEKYLFAEN
jgi:predicted anti-sigma-YlaC factor YlaD